MARRDGIFDRLNYLPVDLSGFTDQVPTRTRRILNSHAAALLADGIVWVLNLQRIARKANR